MSPDFVESSTDSIDREVLVGVPVDVCPLVKDRWLDELSYSIFFAIPLSDAKGCTMLWDDFNVASIAVQLNLTVHLLDLPLSEVWSPQVALLLTSLQAILHLVVLTYQLSC